MVLDETVNFVADKLNSFKANLFISAIPSSEIKINYKNWYYDAHWKQN